MRFVISVFLLALVAGCAPAIHKIDLHSYSGNIGGDKLSIIDSRLDTQIYITGLSIAGTQIYMYDATPDLTEVLSGSIQLSLGDYLLNSKVVVSIDDLDIKNQVGFATADKLSCVIESTVSVNSGLGATIKTLSRNDNNMSPMIRTFGKLIVDQCIKEHGRDIALFLKGGGK